MHPVLVGFLCILSIVSAATPLNAVPGDAAPGDTPDSDLTLTLDNAVERALRHSIELQKSRITLNDGEYSSKRLWAELFPTINASAGISYGNAPLFTGTAEERRIGEHNFGYNISAGIVLNLNAGIPYRMRLLNLAYQQQFLSHEETRRLLEIATAQHFYTLITTRENLAQLDETLGLAERQLEKHRVGRANGLISEATLLQSRLAVETARYELSSARAAYTQDLGVFLSVLGLPPETPAKLEGEFTIQKIDMDPEELIREYLPKRPDIEQQRQAIARLELAERQALLGSRAPSLDLSFSWQGGPSGTRPITNPFSDNLSGSATLRIPVNPWIPGTRESQTLRGAASDIEKALLDLKNTEENAAAQIRSLMVNLRNSWESLEIARLREQVAQRSYELTEQGFLSGTVESLNLETNRNNLAAARYQLLRSELMYQSLVLDLARAINVDWRQLTRSTP
jgi:multidrug efflux system outer membrane protein